MEKLFWIFYIWPRYKYIWVSGSYGPRGAMKKFTTADGSVFELVCFNIYYKTRG